MEQLRMTDGFENNEQGPKRPFIVIDFKNPKEEPIVLYRGEASSDEEAMDIVENVAKIHIDYDTESNVAIAFESDDKKKAA